MQCSSLQRLFKIVRCCLSKWNEDMIPRNMAKEKVIFERKTVQKLNQRKIICQLSRNIEFVIIRIPDVQELSEQVNKTKDKQIDYIFSLRLQKFDISQLIAINRNVNRLKNSNFKNEIMQRIQFRKNKLARQRWQKEHPQAFVVNAEIQRQKVLMIPVYQSMRARATMRLQQLEKMKTKQQQQPQSRYRIVLQRCKNGIFDNIKFLKDALCYKNWKTRTYEDQSIEDESTILKTYEQ